MDNVLEHLDYADEIALLAHTRQNIQEKISILEAYHQTSGAEHQYKQSKH